MASTYVRFPCLKGDTTRKLQADTDAGAVGDAFAALTKALKDADRPTAQQSAMALLDMLEHHETDLLTLTVSMAAAACTKREILREPQRFVDANNGDVMCEFFTTRNA